MLAQQVVERVIRRERGRRGVDVRHPGERQGGVELPGLARPRGERAQAGEQALLGLGPPVPLQVEPGEAEMFAVPEGTRGDGPALEAGNQLVVCHSKMILRHRNKSSDNTCLR